jgi:hypothetical protein
LREAGIRQIGTNLLRVPITLRGEAGRTDVKLKQGARQAEANSNDGEGRAVKSDGLRELEGRQINVALANGGRIDDCQLVSAGRSVAGTLWLFTNGSDLFVDIGEVIAVWESGGCVRAA